MKSTLNRKVLENIISRVEKVSESDSANWGKMNAHEMLCHTADQVRLATGEKKSAFRGNNATKTILKRLILLGMPTPKGKIETTKELKQGVGGTKPTNFLEDQKTLISLLKNFNTNFDEGKLIEHPAFGYMTKKEWARLVYIHMNYHLKQFDR